jgi:hypothetical protein
MSLPGPPGQGYDYVTALTNLRDKIADLSTVQQQQRGSNSRLSRGLQLWRHNRSNVFFVFTMYAMSTASVISAVMAESRLQVGRRGRQQVAQHAACQVVVSSLSLTCYQSSHTITSRTFRHYVHAPRGRKLSACFGVQCSVSTTYI